MTILMLDGICKDGRLELLETPDALPEGRVKVILVPETESLSASGLWSGPEREAARQRAFERMTAGIDLGGPPYPKREELYDRTER